MMYRLWRVHAYEKKGERSKEKAYLLVEERTHVAPESGSLIGEPCVCSELHEHAEVNGLYNNRNTKLILL